MREHLIAAIKPLVDRLSHAMYWRKGKDGPRRIAAKFTPTLLSEHVTGANTFGLCPIVPSESTTRVALLDLDSHDGETPWSDMVAHASALCDILGVAGYHPIPWRSSGGKGIHIYLVWNTPQDAYSVRCMLVDALKAGGYTNGTKGVAAKQVEVFPKQDSVPATGCGNMFILPLAGMSVPLIGDAYQIANRIEASAVMWYPSENVPQLVKPERTITRADPTSFARLQSALATIKNSDDDQLDYDGWFGFICSIHAGTNGSDEGLALAHEFSMRSDKYDPDFLENRVWPYIRSDRDGPSITERRIINAAQATGEWEDPDTLAAFTDCTPTEEEQAAVVPVTAKGARFPVIPGHLFIEGPELDWLIDDVLPAAAFGVMFGESGSGKSFLALDIAGALAVSDKWRGHIINKPRSSVIIAAEGAVGMRKRLKAWSHHHGVELESLGVGVIAGAPNFMLTDDINDIMHSIRAFGRPGVIWIDTWAQVTPGANENSGEDMGKVIHHCQAIHRATGALVLPIHHAGKDTSKGARGWSGLRAAADVEIEITREGHDRCATVTKLKDGEDGAEMPFKLAVVQVGHDSRGMPLTSCAVIHEQPATRHAGPREPNGMVPRIVWREFHDLAGLGDGQVPITTLVPAAVNRMPRPDGRDLRRQYVNRAVLALSEAGWLTIDGDVATSAKVV